jgi:hypothetical protein
VFPTAALPGTGTAMREGYESLRGRQRAVVIVFALIVLVDIIAVLSSMAELNLLDRIDSGAFVADSEIDANDIRQGSMGMIQGALYIAGAVVFIRWLRAAYRNTDVVAPGLRRYGHGWAIGGWFVPILAAWRPKQIINDVWRAGSASPYAEERPPVLLLAWWLSWVASTLLAQAAGRAAFGQDTVDELRTADILYIVSDTWDAIVAVMAVAVVHRVTRHLDEKAAAVPAPEPAPPVTAWLAPERPAGAE